MPNNLYIVWAERWELGIPIIDEQHRGAACLINTLFYFITHKYGADVVLPVVKATLHYSELHMLTEEGLLALSGYPRVEEHQKLHRTMNKKFRQGVIDTMATGNYMGAPEVFMAILREWWLDHMCKADGMFAPHVRNYLTERDKQG